MKKTTVTVLFNGDRDSWDWGDDPQIEARLNTVSTKPTEGSGGWKQEPGGKQIWRCYTNTEESCCGFPVMMDFVEVDRKACIKHAKELGAQLNKALNEKMVYISAYVPEKKEWDGTRAILEAAGFKPGVSLQSGHGKYHNVRWEWNAETHLYTRRKSEKAVRALDV